MIEANNNRFLQLVQRLNQGKNIPKSLARAPMHAWDGGKTLSGRNLLVLYQVVVH